MIFEPHQGVEGVKFIFVRNLCSEFDFLLFLHCGVEERKQVSVVVGSQEGVPPDFVDKVDRSRLPGFINCRGQLLKQLIVRVGEPAVYKALLGGAKEGFEVLEGRIGVLGEGVAGLLHEGPVLGGQVVEDVAVVEAEVDFGHFLAAGVATFQNGVSELLLNFNLDILEVVYVVEEEGRDRLLVLGEEALVLRLLHKASQLKSQAFNGPVFVRRLTHHLLGQLFGV